MFLANATVSFFAAEGHSTVSTHHTSFTHSSPEGQRDLAVENNFVVNILHAVDAVVVRSITVSDLADLRFWHARPLYGSTRRKAQHSAVFLSRPRHNLGMTGAHRLSISTGSPVP